MKPVLRFLILLFVIALGQQSFAYSWNKVDMQEDLLATNCQLSELQMNITICNDSIFIAEVSFVADNPNPFGYNVLLDGVYYSFQQYEDSIMQSFVLELNNPDLGSEILIEVFDEGDISCAVEANFLLECEAPCSIGSPIITVLDCNDSIGDFAIELDFEYENVQSAQFEVHGNATYYGTYQYTDLPITIDGFEGNGDFVYELIIYDYEDSTCSSGYGFFGPVSCPEMMNDCITFEDFDLEFFNLPVSLTELYLGTYQDVDLSAHPFNTGNPNFPFLWGALGIYDSDIFPVGQVSGNVINYEYTSVEFDFNDFLGGSVQSVSFQYVSLYPGVNFGVNSADYQYLTSYSQINNNIPGLDITVSSTIIGEIEIGTVFIQGDISNLIIGGVYGYLDNICFDYLEDVECDLSELDLNVTDCDTSDELSFSFDFEYAGVNEDGFLLIGYNNDYLAEFDYADLPVTIIDLGTDILESYSFGIMTLGSPDTCAMDLDFETPACYLDTSCSINALEYEIVDCNPLDSTFYVNVWFEYANLDSLTVSIFGGGYDWGEFDAWEQPVQLGPFYGNQGVYEVIIQDTYDPECFDVLAVDSPSCLYTDCQLSALEVDIEYCTDSIVYFDASFLAEQFSPGYSYNIYLNEEFYGYNQYSATNNEQTFEFAIEDPQFGSLYTLEIVDEDDVTCATAIEFVLEPCSNDCSINALEYEIVDCNPLDSTFYVNVWFEYDNLDSLTVSIFGEGYDWGEFDAWEQPVTLGPYYGDQGAYEVIIQDTYDSECFDVFGVDSPSCLYTDCQLSALEVDIEYCTDSIVYFDASFLAENPVSSVYNIILNGEFYGYYQYSATNNEQTFEFVIEDPAFGTLVTLELFDEDDVTCATAIEFVLEPCSNDCNLSNLEVVNVESCTDSIVYLDASFLAEQFSPGYPYNIYLNEEFNGYSQYSATNNEQLFSFVIEDPQFGSLYTIEIVDEDDVSCSTAIEFVLEPCSNDCSINALEYEIVDCNPLDSTFYVNVWFEYDNLDSLTVSIFGEGYDWGEFDAWEQPVTLGPYYGDQGAYEVIIQDTYDSECFDVFGVDSPSCLYTDCYLDITNYNIIECSETDSLFYLEVFFEYDNLLGDAVSIFGGGYNWGIYNPALQPMLIGPFFTGDLEYEIIVADQLDLDCFDVVGFEFNGCDEECELIEEIWLENGPDCLGDLCEIEIGVDLSQAGAGFPVDIHLDGFSYFDYPVSQLAGQSFTFVQDSLGFSSVVVCISGSFDCCDTLYFDIPPTVVGDVWPGDANSDNIANNIDLLYIGLASGFQGIDRPEQGIEWEAYESNDWDFFFPESGVNFKHADSNGDGLVDEEDIEAIEENYGLTHGPYDPNFEVGGPSDPPLYVDLPSYVQPDQQIEVDIILGEFSNQVSDLYGVAFTLEFQEGVFQNNEIEFDSTGSWIGGIDGDMYTFSRAADGVFEVDITLVRKDQSNAGTNYGRIGNFIGVIDDVLGLQEASVKIKNVVAISNDETLIQLNLPVDTMIISSTDQVLDDGKIHVYPVPTNKFLYLETDIAEDVSSMEIITLEGVRVRHYDHFESRLDLKALHNGVYLLRVRTDKGIYQERVMIFN